MKCRLLLSLLLTSEDSDDDSEMVTWVTGHDSHGVTSQVTIDVTVTPLIYICGRVTFKSGRDTGGSRFHGAPVFNFII